MAKPSSPAGPRARRALTRQAPAQRTAASPPPTQHQPAPHQPSQPQPTQRADGWTPERRAAFLEALAEGHTVEAACGFVGLSVASAYALRRREGAEAFALGWRAACLLARDRLADLLTSRAIDGQVETYTRADGTTITRHRHDNRLAMSLLTRLDRLAEAPADRDGIGAEPRSSLARAHAQARHAGARPRSGVTHRDSLSTFAPFSVPNGPAGSAAALSAEAAAPPPPPEPQAPEAARFAAAAFPALIALVARDGDAAALRDYVAAQHAGSIPQLPQLRRYRKGQEWLADLPHYEAEVSQHPVWEDEADGEMLTRFAPPSNFTGTEYGRFGDPAYARTLTAEEAAECVPPEA